MVNQTPIVSVLMTAYNREKYIGEAIESVLSSTFQDFELIIVDDSSKDNTVEIAKSYEAKDNRIKIYINETNLGDYPNRNRAASLAIGKYIKYLDSDDIMRFDCLEKMVIGMEMNPSCGFGISSRSLSNNVIHTSDEAYRVHFFERGILDIGPSGTIIRNDVFQIEHGFWEKRCVSDLEFWLRISKKYDVLEMEKNLIYWRQHDNQEFNLGKMEYVEHTLSIIESNLNDCCLENYEKKNILKGLRKSTSRYLVKNIVDLGLKQTFFLWKVNKLRIFDLF